jgi:DNA-binding MarR family transcriptional regulator
MPLSGDPVEQARDHWAAHGWGAAADGMAAVTSLMRAQQIMLGRVEAVLRRFDVTFARYEVLMLLLFSGSGALPMRVIGERLQVHPTSVTNAVDRLERAGLVTREPHPSDRRATLVRHTRDGRSVARKATEALNREVFEQPGIPAASLHRLVDVLAEFRRNAGDWE